MASFDSTIGILRDDLTFEAKFSEGETFKAFILTVRHSLIGEGIPADYLSVHVKDKDQLHALRAALYSALADSYALEGEALTILPALTGNTTIDRANRIEMEVE